MAEKFNSEFSSRQCEWRRIPFERLVSAGDAKCIGLDWCSMGESITHPLTDEQFRSDEDTDASGGHGENSMPTKRTFALATWQPTRKEEDLVDQPFPSQNETFSWRRRSAGSGWPMQRDSGRHNQIEVARSDVQRNVDDTLPRDEWRREVVVQRSNSGPRLSTIVSLAKRGVGERSFSSGRQCRRLIGRDEERRTRVFFLLDESVVPSSNALNSLLICSSLPRESSWTLTSFSSKFARHVR